MEDQDQKEASNSKTEKTDGELRYPTLPCTPENSTPAILKLQVQKPYKATVQQDMVTDTCSLSTPKAEAGGLRV